MQKKITKSESETEEIKEILSNAWANPGRLLYQDTEQTSDTDEKTIGGNLFEIKRKSKKAYNQSPNVGSTINKFSSWIWGENSYVYSDYQVIQDFLDEFMDNWFNDLNLGISEYLTNMLIDGEAFPMVTILNMNGDMRARAIEDNHIMGDSDDNNSGIITDPDDVTVTLFYMLTQNNQTRLVPDINLLWNPDLYQKAIDLGNDLKGFNQDNLKDAMWKGANKKRFKEKTGTPFKQFIIPWKNLLGIKNLKRSVSSIRRAIEADKNYDTMLKYTMTYFRSVMGYVDVFEPTPDVIGARAFKALNDKMKTEEGRKELYNIGITKPKSPGDTLVTLPGLKYKRESPNLSSIMSGYFKDFAHQLSAGLEMPADITSSDSTDTTFAALKMSRQAPQLSVIFARSRLEQFLRKRFFRSIFKIKSILDRSFPFHLTITEYFTDLKTGKDKPIKRKVETINKKILKFSFPDVDLSGDESKVKGLFGSKNLGSVDELSLSQEDAAKKLDIHNYTEQRRNRKSEDDKYGKKDIIKEKEGASEDKGANEDNNKAK